jgi:asparagine synthase (glutamine-hydrolysing)
LRRSNAGAVSRGARRGRWSGTSCSPSDYDDYWYFRDHYDESLPLLTRLQVLDFHTYLPDDILTKVDRVSMANSLEARVPLLSTALVEAVFSLPASVLGTEKQLLKTLSTPLLPASIIEREKKGFGVPAATWSEGVFDRSKSRQENLLFALYPELAL